MSTQSRSAGPENYEQGFVEQNQWLRPVAFFVVLCIGLLALMVVAYATLGWLGGTFGQVLFGMLASLVFMSIVLSAGLLIVNAIRYLIDNN